MSFEFEPNSIATCPFDPDHKVAVHKLQSHIVKCKRSHPELERHLVTCPFNASHLIPNSEKEKHIINCIDKDRLLIKRSRQFQNCELSVPIYETYIYNQDDEDWDRETDIDILLPSLDIRKPIILNSIEKSKINDRSQNCTLMSNSQSSLNTLTEPKISRGRGQMLKIYGFTFKCLF